MSLPGDNSVKIDLGLDKYNFSKKLGSVFDTGSGGSSGLNLDFGNAMTAPFGSEYSGNMDWSRFMEQDFTKLPAEQGFLTKYNDQIGLGLQGLGAVASLGNMYYAGQGLNYANKSLKEKNLQLNIIL